MSKFENHLTGRELGSITSDDILPFLTRITEGTKHSKTSGIKISKGFKGMFEKGPFTK